MISLPEIFLAFLKVGSLAFGGAYAAMPLIEQQIVKATGWMSFQEFYDLIAIDELTPGPILINSATFIGMKLGGIPGAIVATLGCILPACIVSLILISLYRKYKEIPMISEIMNCLKSMSVAMIFSTVLKIFVSAVFPNGLEHLKDINILAVIMIGISYYLLKRCRINPIFLMLGCGCISLILSFLF